MNCRDLEIGTPIAVFDVEGVGFHVLKVGSDSVPTNLRQQLRIPQAAWE